MKVGYVGFVASSAIRLLKEVGIRGLAQWKVLKELATVAKGSSHWLWLKRKETVWDANFLVTMPHTPRSDQPVPASNEGVL